MGFCLLLGVRYQLAYRPSLRNLSGLQHYPLLARSAGYQQQCLDRTPPRSFGRHPVFRCEGLWRGEFTMGSVESWLIVTEQVEFALSLLKIIACIGFMILGIIIDVGGVPTDDRGYIGARYWYVYMFTRRAPSYAANSWKQAFALLSFPQWFPRLLQCLRHCGIRLHWHRADWSGCGGNERPEEGDPQGLKPSRVAYWHFLHCQLVPRWFDRTGEQSLVHRRLIAPLTFRHCNSACWH